MIFITAVFTIKPEHADDWPALSRAFTEATQAEAGCLFFRWSRSLDDPTEYVLVEAFIDGTAGGAHVGSAHFKQAQVDLPPYLVRTPQVISQDLPDKSGWDELGEMAVTS